MNDTKNKLHEEIRQDISDRSSWRDRMERLVRHRLGERKRSLLYPGAPNFVEPIIDDNIRAGVAQEMSVMFSTRQLANFIPLSQEASELQRHAEVGFDSMLRLMLDFRSKMENAIDNKKERGFAVLKLVENPTAYEQAMGKQVMRQQIPDEYGQPVEVIIDLPAPVVPDLEVVDPYDFVVPVTTRRLRDAERCTHIHRYSVREFEELAEKYEWQNAKQVIAVATETSTNRDSTNGRDGFQPQIGLETVNDQIDKLEIWETYHYKDGKRYRSILCPAAVEYVLQCEPWIWADDGTERPWPFVQLRQENRRQEFYDCRGDAELLLDNQKTANSYLNAKGVQLDFFSKPVFSGPRGNAQKIKWTPGEMLPDGISPIQMPRIDSVFDYSADMERAKAARRSGASQGSYGDTRQAGDKTATQVNAESLASQRLTNVSVLRDGEPMSLFYELMWQYLRHNPVDLPMINESRQFQGQLSQAVYSVPFKVESAASAQHANPDFVLQQMMSLGQFLQANPYVRQHEFAKILVDQVNPQITNKLVFDPTQPGDGTMPLEQQVAQMAQQGQQMAEAVQSNSAQVDNITKYVGTLAMHEQENEDGEQ